MFVVLQGDLKDFLNSSAVKYSIVEQGTSAVRTVTVDECGRFEIEVGLSDLTGWWRAIVILT